MSHRRFALTALVAILTFSAIILAQDSKTKLGPLTGTWQCMAHGGPNGDLPFTLYLQQQNETVTGSVSSPLGDTDLSSATFNKNALEIHIDSPDRSYLLTAKLQNGELSGDWSTDAGQKGTWEGKQGTPSASTKSQ